MRIYSLLLLFFIPFYTKAQTVNVSGRCISGTIALNKIESIEGKPAYQGTGTVMGYSSITVTVYWISAPDYVWVLDFEGQPYFLCSSTTALPPGTDSKTYSWQVVDGTECTGGAPLKINGSGILAVTLNSFSAKAKDSHVRLFWKTASETNNKGFEVQRSIDLAKWNKIGFVNGAGNSTTEMTYTFNDADPIPGKNYYRLVQFDLDGKPSYSTIENVDISKDGYFTLSNNPGNGQYRLQIISANGVSVSVSDMKGRRLVSKKIDAGVHQIDISEYAKGTYILRMQIGDKVFNERLIKQ